MTLFAAIGKAQGLDAAETAIRATDQALALTGRHNIALAIVAAAHDYPVQQVVNGVNGLLSDTPLLGFSTPAQITVDGMHQRSIVTALLVGDQLQADSDWWSTSNEKGDRGVFQSLNFDHPDNQAVLLVVDGLTGDAQRLLEAIPKSSSLLAGCLAGGDIASGRTYQIGGSGFGTGGAAAAALRGKIKIGVGTQHGWQPVGLSTRITRADHPWVHTLDDRPACEAYASIFGYPARDWTNPPLNHLVRLYPLGFERQAGVGKNGRGLVIRSPLLVDPDGSLRMNSSLPEGQTAQILVSSSDNCLSAARCAAEDALKSLGDAPPCLALILADISWQMMFQSQPGMEINVVREVIGSEVPITRHQRASVRGI
ncbi:MAG: FIST signal transduction protein, partial [Anaerolineales bacterium]